MSWQKNEPSATKRRCMLIITDDGGMPANPGHSFASALFVVGVNAPNADLATGTLTNVRRPHPAVADFTFTAATTDVCTKVAHDLETGDGPVRAFSTTTLPAGLAAATDYYIIKIDADTFYLATSLANAYAGTRIDITSTGTGTHTLDLTGVGSKRGMWGHFIYEAAQVELNHDNPETSVFIDGVVSGSSYLRMNGGGALTPVQMTTELASVWDVPAEGGLTFGQLAILEARTMFARLIVSGTTHTFRDLADTVNSHHGTVTASGRGPVTIDNAP